VRFRKLFAVAAAAAVVVTGLTACDSKVGVAAVVDGHEITDSQVASYMTNKAEAFPSQDAKGNAISIPPRVFVLETLLDERVYTQILQATPAGMPSEAKLNAAKQQLYGATADTDVAKQYVQHGYTKELAKRALRVALLLESIKTEVQQGLDIDAVLKKVHPKISVSPRYGSWDAQNFQLSTDPRAGLPDFVTFRSTPSATATPATG
jgi:hypothetical protein